MVSDSRRQFLSRATMVVLASPVGLAAGRFAHGEAPRRGAGITNVYLDPRRTIASLDRHLFGSFLEQLGRAIYGGIYDPGSPLSDASGFRTDVLQEVRSLGVPIIRYPGGNFVSGYNWLDGVGPVENRPQQLDKAWNSLNSNRFGTNEFMAWCRAAGAEPLMGLNLGTGTPEQAAALLEYCNVEKGTQWSELRRKHGVADPHNVRHWCLGNEMDGPWQIGHMEASEYGLKAADAARQMRAIDPSVRLIACGSSGPQMATYLDWDRQVLEQCYEYVDGLSLHRYMGNTAQETGGDSTRYLALNLSMEQQIAETLAVCDYVRAHKRSPKKLWLSFDEWNVWYRARSGAAVDGARQKAPHLLEEVYDLEDALLVGGMINTLIRNADRVRIACLAQLVNVIAPIMTNASGLLRQTIYYPYSWALQLAQGDVLNLVVDSPTYDAAQLGAVPYIDCVGLRSERSGTTTLLALNRDLVNSREIAIHWQGAVPQRLAVSWVLTGSDLKAVNSFESPKRVQPDVLDKPVSGSGTTTFQMPPRSYAAIQWQA